MQLWSRTRLVPSKSPRSMRSRLRGRRRATVTSSPRPSARGRSVNGSHPCDAIIRTMLEVADSAQWQSKLDLPVLTTVAVTVTRSTQRSMQLLTPKRYRLGSIRSSRRCLTCISREEASKVIKVTLQMATCTGCRTLLRSLR